MNVIQEPKYMIVNGGGVERPEAQIANRKTGIVIPGFEPIMIFRAQDIHTAQMIHLYAELCKNPGHQRAAMLRRAAFLSFQDLQPELVKDPD